MVSVILANRLFHQWIRAAALSHLFHCQFVGEMKMYNILPYSDLLAITGIFSRLTQVKNVSASANLSEHCLDVFTTSLSSTTKAVSRRCLVGNNPLDLRFNI